MRGVAVMAMSLWVGGWVSAAQKHDSSFLFTEAPQFEPLGVVRFPAGARVMLFSKGAARPLVPQFAASADAAVSFDAAKVLFAGKRSTSDAWSIWEIPLTGGEPRRLSSGDSDCILPFYLPQQKVIYACRTGQDFQIEIARLDGSAPEPLTFGPGNKLPAGVLRDGRILFVAPVPMGTDIYTMYSDGTGVETYRCDHTAARHSPVQLASGDILFNSNGKLGRFTSTRAVQMDVTVPSGEYLGPALELMPGELLLSYRQAATGPFGLYQVGSTPTAVVARNAFQPVGITPRPVPPYHPSSRGDRDDANLLCLSVYTTKDAPIQTGSVSKVRLRSLDGSGAPVVLGEAPVESDGSFYVQTPTERPLRFELLDAVGTMVRAEKGWFWTRRGEQRVCVGCHAGPERSPDNAVPQVLLRTQTPVLLGGK